MLITKRNIARDQVNLKITWSLRNQSYAHMDQITSDHIERFKNDTSEGKDTICRWNIGYLTKRCILKNRTTLKSFFHASGTILICYKQSWWKQSAFKVVKAFWWIKLSFYSEECVKYPCVWTVQNFILGRIWNCLPIFVNLLACIIEFVKLKALFGNHSFDTCAKFNVSFLLIFRT